MKNIQGNQKSLIVINEEGRVVYEFTAYKYGTFTEETYDKHGKELTFKSSKGYSYKYTRDKFGNVLTFQDPKGVIKDFTKK